MGGYKQQRFFPHEDKFPEAQCKQIYCNSEDPMRIVYYHSPVHKFPLSKTQEDDWEECWDLHLFSSTARVIAPDIPWPEMMEKVDQSNNWHILTANRIKPQSLL